MSNPVYVADRAIAAVLQSDALQQNPLLHGIGVFFNWWGGPGVIWCAALLWLGGRALKYSRVSLLGLRGVEGIAVASAISGIMKGFAGRARPFITPGAPWHWNFLHGWTDARYFSMPSGHTTATFAFAAAVMIVALHQRLSQKALIITLAFLSALLVAFARTYTNQHWFSDVAVAAFLGATTGFVLARWHERHPRTAFDRVLLGATAVADAA
jgi:membrane-associated phospholipid phosphatase